MRVDMTSAIALKSMLIEIQALVDEKNSRIAHLERQNAELAATIDEVCSLIDETVEHRELRELQAEIGKDLAGLRDRSECAGILAARDARIRQEKEDLAAALAECPMFSSLENPDTERNLQPIIVEWQAEKVFQWMDARRGDLQAAGALLADRDARMKRDGWRGGSA